MAPLGQRRRVVTSVVVVALLVGTVYLAGGLVSGIKSVAKGVVAPFSWSVSALARPIGHVFAGVANYSDVVAQNQKLQYELGQAQQQLAQNQAATTQLALLTQSQHVATVTGVTSVLAQVTQDSPTNFAATITISKGQSDGVLDGMPVMGSGGLVGRVISVSAHRSEVRLLSDPSTLLSATFGNGATDVLVAGQGLNANLQATAIPITSAISVGQLLSTSGLQGGLFPPGLPVARVAKVLVSPGATTYSIDIAPTAVLQHLAYVDVLQWEPST